MHIYDVPKMHVDHLLRWSKCVI